MAAPLDRWKELPDVLGRWQLAVEGEYIDTPHGCVVFARRGNERLALKIQFEHADDSDGNEGHAATALAHYAGAGAVRLIGREGRVLLLERAVPGVPASERVHAGFDDQATEAVAGVIEALHVRAPPAAALPTVEDWAAGFQRYLDRFGAPGEARPPLPLPLVDRAHRIYTELAASQSRRYLLHGDLHHDNILHARERGWLAIDPKAVIGEIAYETGAMLRNPSGDIRNVADARIVLRRVRLMADRLDLEPQRILGWGFAEAVLAGIWAVEDGADPRCALAVAETIKPLI
jgi:streptomycin 6-kinase